MKALVAFAVLLVLGLPACSRVGTGRTCEWRPTDGPSRLDSQDRSQVLHLTDEALRAEDAAIRYADLHHGRRSGAYVGREAYQEIRDSCMTELFEALATHHSVTVAQVRDSVYYRRTSVDVLILMSFVAFYSMVANPMIRWLSQSAFFEVAGLRWVATSVAACGAAAAGLVLFGLYFAAFEMIRIGNTHMSYRAWRHPWVQHKSELLVGGVILFVLLAVYRYTRTTNRVTDTGLNPGPFGG